VSGPAATPAPDGTGSPHPVTGLDDVVHQRVRLGILTIAHEARRVEFGYLRTQLELTAGNLSQHLGVLETAGLVEVEKGYAGRRGRTWISLTAAGDAALAAEIGRLKQLIARVETPAPTTGAERRPASG
jgi:DNA-binding MarR family transcriptional regulator